LQFEASGESGKRRVITMGRHILHLRFDLPADPDVDLTERLRRLLEDITPRVQMIEPDMAVLDLTGALPYWKRDARGLAELVQLRVLAHVGLRSCAGVAPNVMLAAMACALTPLDRRTVIDDSPVPSPTSCAPARSGNCPAWVR
jgi:DNA polymerase-4